MGLESRLGSGAGGNLTCETGATAGLVVRGVPAGGIVLALAGDLSVGEAGAITASAADAGRAVAASGGCVHPRATASTRLATPLPPSRGLRQY